MLRLPSTTTHPLFLASFLLAFLDLNCLVRDQSLNDIFAIKIARSESVSILQQSIKRVRGLKPDAPPQCSGRYSVSMKSETLTLMDVARLISLSRTRSSLRCEIRDLSIPIKASTSCRLWKSCKRSSQRYPFESTCTSLCNLRPRVSFHSCKHHGIVASTTHFVSFPRLKLFGSRPEPQ